MPTSRLQPEYTTPTDLAEHLGMSARTVNEKVAELGAYAKLGRRKVMFPRHVNLFMEAIQCPSPSTDAATSGTSEGRFPEADYAALRARLTGTPQNGSRQKRRPRRGTGSSTGRVQG